MRNTRRTITFLTLSIALCGATLAHAQTKKSTPTVSRPAPSKPAASSSAGHPATGGHPSTGGAASAANHGTSPGSAARPGITHTPGGGTTVRTADNREFNRGANGRVNSFHGAHGEEARFGHDGHVREVRSGNMHIEHGPGGARRVEMVRADHSRVVMEGRGRGFVQRPYTFHNHSYVRREYYVGGVRYSRFYRPYYYHGLYLHLYVPGIYYAPAYYGWAYSPWARPVAYSWGWGGSPWYGYYGGYFAPYPVYAAPSLWLTDYVISQQLQAAYQAGVAAGASGNAHLDTRGQGARLVYASYSPAPTSQPVALTPEIKQDIANEVQAYLAVEQAAAQASGDDQKTNGLDKLLGDGKPHTFVVATGLTVSPTSGDCSLTAGDVLQTTQAPGANADQLNAIVLASKSSDCAANIAVPVKLDDLQEMQNQLMANVDQGLGQLKAHPGEGGLPAPPAAALAGQTDAPYTSAAPPPDANVADELKEADKQASQTEQQVLAEATPPPDASADAPTAPAAATAGQGAPVTIALGQTPDQVKAGMGNPARIVNLGTKIIYVYSDLKVTFLNGKVSDIQ
jgi:hypothetical protein